MGYESKNYTTYYGVREDRILLPATENMTQSCFDAQTRRENRTTAIGEDTSNIFEIVELNATDSMRM